MALPAAFAIWRYVPREETRADARVDWLGAALLLGRARRLLYGLSKANAWGWGSPRVLGLVVGGLALAVVLGVGGDAASISRWWTCACCAAGRC